MTSSSFYEEGSKLLTPGAFEFVLDSELKRAVRSQNFLTLVTLEASREWEGMTVTADDGTVHEVAQLIGKEVRDTDLLGHTERGHARARPARRRLRPFHARHRPSGRAHRELRIRRPPLRIAVGAACYPTHAVDAESLKRQALSRPIVNWRGGVALRRSELREHASMKHMSRLLPLAAAALCLGSSIPAFAQRPSIPPPTRSTSGAPAAFADRRSRQEADAGAADRRSGVPARTRRQAAHRGLPRSAAVAVGADPARTARSRCRWSATWNRPDARRSNCAIRSRPRSRNTSPTRSSP